jgi:hypothetical protein
MRIVPLAYNEHGHRFPVAAEAAFWLVKAMKKGPGAPRQLWVEENAMALPIDDGIADLRELAGVGRYRLDAIDQHGIPVPGMPPAYVEVIEAAAPEPSAPALRNAAAPFADAAPAVPTSEYLRIIESLALAHAQSSREATANSRAIMEAAAALVRAADGAGIASRPWMVEDYRNAVPDDTDDEAEAVPPAPAAPPAVPPSLRDMLAEKLVSTAFRGIDALVAQKLAPSLPSPPVLPALPATTAPASTPPSPAAPVATASRPVPSVRPEPAPSAATASTPAPRPAPTATAAAASAAAPQAAAATATATPAPSTPPQDHDTGENDTAASASVDAQKLAEATDASEQHLEAVLAALTPAEHARVTGLIKLVPAEQATQWLAYLAGMPVDQAVAAIRAQLAKVPV